MLTYHSYVHSLAGAVAGSASRILVRLAGCVAARDEAALEAFESSKLEILVEVETLKKSSEELLAAIPRTSTSESLARTAPSRCVYRIFHRKDKPQSCLHDPSDILANDLPAVMSAFDDWYESTAAPHPELASRLRKHIQSGDMTSAVREGFAFWKTRIVKTFDLPDNIDGSKLSQQLFGESEAAAEILTKREREACDNLYTSLYTLARNPSSHGDVNLDRQLSEGALTLLSWLLATLENAHRRPQQVTDTP